MAHGRLVKVAGYRDWIPNFKELKRLMSKTGQPSGPSSLAAKPSKPSKDWKSKGTYVSSILPIKLHIATSPNLLPVVLTFVSQEEAKGSINLDALLDSGYLAGDFIARRIVDKYNVKPVIHSTAKLSVRSGLDNTCYDIVGVRRWKLKRSYISWKLILVCSVTVFIGMLTSKIYEKCRPKT